MTTNDETRHVLHRSIRLPGYDYGQEGAYFVTICTEDRCHCFGTIVGNAMVSNAAGQMVEDVWRALPSRFPNLVLDEFVVMPNHLHGILLITPPSAGSESAPRLGDMVGAFKSISTHEYILGVWQQAWPGFAGHLWQRNYYEHIIRNETALSALRRYIADNPAKWALDPEYAR